MRLPIHRILAADRKTQVKACFFARLALILHPKIKVDRFEQLATTVKNAKTQLTLLYAFYRLSPLEFLS